MKKKAKWILLFAAAALLLAVITVFILFPHYWFIAGEYMGIRCDRVPMDRMEVPETVEVTLQDITESDNITFDQSLMLINTEYPLPDDFIPDVSEYKDTGVYMNSCMPEAYQKLSSAVAEKYAEKLYISSDFRTAEEQEEMQQTNADVAADPGSSEHEAGLGLDVYVPYYAGFGFIKSDAGRFVNAKCWEYGFIIRYPSFGESETGIPYEPWHIRYVGEPHANVIYNNHLTLEEYIQSLEIGAWYEVDGYIISRQKPNGEGSLQLPKEYTNAVISPDNTGCYIVTVHSNKSDG
ncbi:MAG: M15 family metallopeptidase [Clostridia bacterium]|nr:M15 family metallopeptidase [Clostridia bacterium]